jgi:hypothetical protein
MLILHICNIKMSRTTLILIISLFIIPLISYCQINKDSIVVKTETSCNLDWEDYNLILHSSLETVDSVLKSKNFARKEGNENIYTYNINSKNVAIEVSNDNKNTLSLKMTTDDSEYCQRIYQDLLKFISTNNFKSIGFNNKAGLAYYEYDRLFRVNVNSNKYIFTGIEIRSD